MDRNIVEHNREAWNRQVALGNRWTLPLTPEEVAAAREGRYTLLLTPIVNTPRDWLGDVDGKQVLCLASGGGQQGPTFAAMGAVVTVFDNSPAQLDRDREVALREGLQIRLEQGDMRDLSRFPDNSFDLIFHPVSNCFVDDILPVWRESYRVLRSGGALLSGFNNPLLYLFDLDEYDRGNLCVRNRIPYSDLEQLPPDQLEQRIRDGEPLEFGHTLEDQIGGQTRAGFVIAGLFEDGYGGSDDPLEPFVKRFIATRALKL